MKRSPSSGFSVLELTMAAALVGILTTLVFGAYAAGLKSMFKSQAQNELLSELQVMARRVSNEMQQTSIESVSLSADGEAVSYLTCYDADGIPQLSPGGSPLWEAYLVVYLDRTIKSVVLNRVDLKNTSPQRTVPTPIEKFKTGGTTKPINSYRNAGRPIARYIEDLNIELFPSLPGGYRFSIEAVKPAEGNRSASRSSMVFTVVVRN